MFCEKMVDLVRISNFLFFIHINSIFNIHSTVEDRKKDHQQPNVVPPPDENHHGTPLSSIPGMDDEEFRRRGKEMIDYIADYLLHIR
jgi:hypothetical protein